MKKIILIALVVCLFACTKATQDGGRALDNANSVVTQGGPKVWTDKKVWKEGEKTSCVENSKGECSCPDSKKDSKSCAGGGSNCSCGK